MKKPFSYVVLKYMHDVFTREFVNVAVAVYAPQAGFLRMRRAKRLKRAIGLFPGIDRSSVLQMLQFLESKFGEAEGDFASRLDRFTVGVSDIAKGILPTDDSGLQWSSSGGGVTDDPKRTLDELFERMVTRHEKAHPQERRLDAEIWDPFERELRHREVLSRLQERTLSAGRFEHRFDHVWQPRSGDIHLLLPLSFDLLKPSDIVDKGISWNGRINQLQRANSRLQTYVLLGKPSGDEHASAFEEAKGILSASVDDERLVPEEQAPAFAEEFSNQMTGIE